MRLQRTVRETPDHLERMRDDLHSALDETDRLRSQIEQMIGTNRVLSDLLRTTDIRSGELLKLLVTVRALIEANDSYAAIDRLQDILVTVVGTTDFLVYALDHDNDQLIPIAGSGDTHATAPQLPLAGSWLGDVVRSGEVLIPHGSRRSTRAPKGATVSAVVPLKVLDRVLGAIVIASVLPHREPLNVCDREILGLLGAYAATAIIAADRRAEWKQLPLLAS